MATYNRNLYLSVDGPFFLAISCWKNFWSLAGSNGTSKKNSSVSLFDCDHWDGEFLSWQRSLSFLYWQGPRGARSSGFGGAGGWSSLYLPLKEGVSSKEAASVVKEKSQNAIDRVTFGRFKGKPIWEVKAGSSYYVVDFKTGKVTGVF